MLSTDKRKQSLYFPANMLAEIQHEAARLDRSLSWVMQYAWRAGSAEVKRMPSVGEHQAKSDGAAPELPPA